MSSEIREKPLPTPHPDQARTPPSGGERKGGAEPEKSPEFDLDEMVFDSCVDDLGLQLSGTDFHPDPALDFNDPAAAEKALDPATAEIFEGMRHGSGEHSIRRSGWGKVLSLFRVSAGRSRASSSGPRRSGDAIPAPHRTGEIRRVDSGSSDDESAGDGRGFWMQLLLLSYSSAVTLGLAWVLWTGRAIHPAEERGRDDAPGLTTRGPREPWMAVQRSSFPPFRRQTSRWSARRFKSATLKSRRSRFHSPPPSSSARSSRPSIALKG